MQQKEPESQYFNVNKVRLHWLLDFSHVGVNFLFRSSSIILTMAQLKVFSLLGDSNVRNNLNKTAYRANPAIKAAEVLSCGHFEIFRDTLLKIRPESNVCLIACITNFMTSIDDGPSSVSQRVQPVLQDVREVLLDGRCLKP